MTLKALRYATAKAVKGSTVRLGMAATLIFELLCVAGVLFMIRFLIALSRDGRTKSRCHVVYLTSLHAATEDDFSPLAAVGGATLRKSDANSRPRFSAVAGGRKQLFRRVG